MTVTPNLFHQVVEAGKKRDKLSAGAKPERTYASRKEAVFPKVEQMMSEGDLQGVLNSLTGKQRLFVQEYIVDLNGTKAVSRAGYAAKHGNENRIAHQLLNNKAIRYCIDGLLAQRQDLTPVDDTLIISKLLDIVERCEAKSGGKFDPQAALRGLELLGKHLGMFKERQEISGPGGGPIETRDVQDNADEFLSALDRLADRAKNDKSKSGPNPGAATG